MRRPALVLATFLSLALGALAVGAGSAGAEIRKGDRAAELTGGKGANGKAFSLKALRGSWVVVTFGGSWCKPCKKELPAWDKLAARWKGKVTFVAVNLDNDPAAGKKFMDKLKLKHLVRVYAPEDSASAGDIYSPPAQPSSYVINPKGVVVELHEGYQSGDDGKMDALLKKLVTP